jgi:hypothetical protein
MDASPSLAEPVAVALFVYRRAAQLPRTLECLQASRVECLCVSSDGGGPTARPKTMSATAARAT